MNEVIAAPNTMPSGGLQTDTDAVVVTSSSGGTQERHEQDKNESVGKSTERHGQISTADFPEKPPAINIDGLSPRLMKQWRLAPLEATPEFLRVAMANPNDLYAIEALEMLYGARVIPVRANEDDILAAIYRWYEADMDLAASDTDQEERSEEGLWDDPEQLKDMASEAPVIRLVNHLISQAIEVGASDIHFEPFRDHLKVRYRIDGVLHEMETIAKRLQPAITSRVKLMSKMNIAEMRLPQDGRIKVKERAREIDIRVSSLPTLFGESLVLRLLNRDEVKLDLESLGLSQEMLDKFDRVITRPYGMILVTGPTGSGKTTTLYAVMNRINSPDKKIVTVEDPVEYQLDGINQIHVKTNIGLTFASALRTILRQDPDVILVGEIRDGETAEIAIQSALTGHLVFSTLHTNDAPSAITRLQEMGVEAYLLSSCLLAVVAQRLVRRICPHCKKEVPVNETLWDEMRHLGGNAVSERPEVIWKGEGCSHCAGTGYAGRIGIYEFMEISPAIHRLIMQGADSSTIMSEARKEGMRTLREDGMLHVIHGVTTLEEVIRVTNN